MKTTFDITAPQIQERHIKWLQFLQSKTWNETKIPTFFVLKHWFGINPCICLCRISCIRSFDLEGGGGGVLLLLYSSGGGDILWLIITNWANRGWFFFFLHFGWCVSLGLQTKYTCIVLYFETAVSEPDYLSLFIIFKNIWSKKINIFSI